MRSHGLMTRVLITMSVIWIFSYTPSVMAAYGSQEAPRIMNLWFTWQLPEEKLSELAKWDVIVLDMDCIDSTMNDLKLLIDNTVFVKNVFRNCPYKFTTCPFRTYDTSDQVGEWHLDDYHDIDI